MEENEKNSEEGWKKNFGILAVASFIDTRGNLFIGYSNWRKKKIMRYSAYFKNKEFLEAMQDFLGMGSVIVIKSNNENTNYKYQITDIYEIGRLLRAVYPNLKMRKESVKYILDNYKFDLDEDPNKDFNIEEWRKINFPYKYSRAKRTKSTQEVKNAGV